MDQQKQPQGNDQGLPPPGYNVSQQQFGYPQQQGYVNPQQQQAGYPQQGVIMQAPGSYPLGTVMAQPAYVTGQPGQNVVMAAPQNHAGLAWFSCLLCFWPLGLVAIIKSNEVDTSFRRGDLATANSASRSAKQFSMISIGLGIGSWVLGVIMIIIYVAVAGSTTRTYYYG